MVTKKKVSKKKVTKKKTTKTVAPKKRGRPSEYDPSFCQIAIDALEKGFSKEAVAGHLRINKDTLYQYIKKHPDFADAIKEGLELSRIFWEKKALETITHTKAGTQLNSTSWIFNMKNRFGWRDKMEVSVDEDTKKSFGFKLDQDPNEVDK